jgi:hypothetical protein
MKLLGCWYSNNEINPKIMRSSLASISRAQQRSKETDVNVRTCTWEDIAENPFKGFKTHFKLSSHFGIAIQILRTIYEEERAGNTYNAVIFLEHDVLYPEDYFDRVGRVFEANPEAYGVSNLDYIGMNHTGWVKVHTRHEPMHQLSLRHDFAKYHFECVLKKCIIDGAEMLEPNDKSMFIQIPFVGEKPSCHLNHSRHFTTHFTIYDKDSNGLTVHPYWGDYKNYYPEDERLIEGY